MTGGRDEQDREVQYEHEHDAGGSERVPEPQHVPEPTTSRHPDAIGAGADDQNGPAQPPIPGIPGPGAFFDQIVAQSYSGPIPPEVLLMYEDVVPGSAQRVLEATLLEPENRISRLADAEIETARRGQGWAIFLALACIVIATVFFARGSNVAGAAFMSYPLVMLIGTFIPAIGGKRK